MSDQKYQVFVSSTYEDLKVERSRVIQAVLELGHIPVGMEMFGAATQDAWNVIKRTIAQSDYYVVVVAQRYGSPAEGGISFTEKEYDFAVEKGIPVLGFIVDDAMPLAPGKVDSDKAPLLSFKSKIKMQRTVSFWQSPDDLSTKVVAALAKAFATDPRPGWVRGSTVSTEAVAEIARLSATVEAQRKRLEELGTRDLTAEQVLDAMARTSKTIVVSESYSDYKNEQSFGASLAAIFDAVAAGMLVDDTMDSIRSESHAPSFQKIGIEVRAFQRPTPSSSWRIS